MMLMSTVWLLSLLGTREFRVWSKFHSRRAMMIPCWRFVISSRLEVCFWQIHSLKMLQEFQGYKEKEDRVERKMGYKWDEGWREGIKFWWDKREREGRSHKERVTPFEGMCPFMRVDGAIFFWRKNVRLQGAWTHPCRGLSFVYCCERICGEFWVKEIRINGLKSWLRVDFG